MPPTMVSFDTITTTHLLFSITHTKNDMEILSASAQSQPLTTTTKHCSSNYINQK